MDNHFYDSKIILKLDLSIPFEVLDFLFFCDKYNSYLELKFEIWFIDLEFKVMMGLECQIIYVFRSVFGKNLVLKEC